MKTWILALMLLNPLERLDWTVARAVQEERRPALEPVMAAASSWARPPIVSMGLAVVLAADVASGGGWSTVRLAAVSLAGTNLVVESLKRIVGRERPDGERRRSNSSFPSSHAANAFAIAWLLRSRWRRSGIAVFALALLVSFSRMYLNRHFLSDVVGGALIGCLMTWLASRWLPVRARRKPSPAAPPIA
ncbi:MAG TPA: phosphatase PAP2 family protein [Terriglobales bacterium]|nr:phosphatase PAP2 family protein [Terriglobales bacterium]